jgi:DNA-binding XRE family transcriptional regulator
MHQVSKADTGVIAARLLEARKAAGLTQQEAAEHLGVSRPTLIAVEKGTRAVKPDELVKLAMLYGRSLNTLVRAGSEPQPIEPHLRASLRPEADPELSAVISELTAYADDYRALEQITGNTPFHKFPAGGLCPAAGRGRGLRRGRRHPRALPAAPGRPAGV